MCAWVPYMGKYGSRGSRGKRVARSIAQECTAGISDGGLDRPAFRTCIERPPPPRFQADKLKGSSISRADRRAPAAAKLSSSLCAFFFLLRAFLLSLFRYASIIKRIMAVCVEVFSNQHNSKHTITASPVPLLIVNRFSTPALRPRNHHRQACGGLGLSSTRSEPLDSPAHSSRRSGGGSCLSLLLCTY